LQVEVDEEAEVRGEKGATKDGSRFRASTVAVVGQDAVKVRCRKVSVGWRYKFELDSLAKEKKLTAKIDDEEVNYELNDLHHRQVLFPLQQR
jgi:hypothetical protein